MVGTDGGSGSISEHAVYSQDEVDNRITTLASGQRVSVSSGGVNSVAVPVVWQLVGTDGGSGGISKYAIYS